MTALPLADRRTAVYRLFDAEGNLLYVGCSCTPDPRIDQHRGKPWWPEVTDVTVTWLPDRFTALRYEAEAILAEGPRHNLRRTDPDLISAPAATRTRSADTGLTFDEVASEVDIPVDWLRKGVALGKLPHSCDDPDADEVWFAPEDIRDLHTIYDYGNGRNYKRRAVYRSLRFNRCSHNVF